MVHPHLSNSNQQPRMFRTYQVARSIVFACAVVGLAACGADQEDSGDDANAIAPSPTGSSTSPSSSEPPAVASPSGATCSEQLIITDATNYSFSNTLNVEMTTLKDATDLTFDWSEVTTDLFGKPLDPVVDVDLVLVSLWGMTPTELEQNLRIDNLPLSVNKGAITSYPEDSFASQTLLNFDLLGEPLDEAEIWTRFDTSDPQFQYPQDTHTFMLMLSTGTLLGKGARMLSFFNLDPGAEQTTLAVTNESTKLDYSVSLTTAEPVSVPTGTGTLNIEWGEMSTNALGNPYIGTQITEAVVAHYPDRTLEELEAQFLNLEELAGGWWSAEVTAGTSIGLETLVDDAGMAFPGIDAQGVWLVALFCTKNCGNPAPWSITILEPCAEPG